MKKRKGSIDSIAFILIGILAIYIVVMSAIYIFNYLMLYEDVNSVARAYLLEMETVGYLNPEKKTQLISDLSMLQVNDIDLSGTSMSDVGYGNRIYLDIKCDIPGSSLNTVSGNMFKFFFENVEWPILVRRESTAKR